MHNLNNLNTGISFSQDTMLRSSFHTFQLISFISTFYSYIHSLFNFNFKYLKTFIIFNIVQYQLCLRNQSVILNPQNALQKNQTIITKKIKFFHSLSENILAWARISLFERNFSRLSEDGLENRSNSSTIFAWARIFCLEQKWTREQVSIFTWVKISLLERKWIESRFSFSLKQKSHHLYENIIRQFYNKKTNYFSNFINYYPFNLV